MSAVHKHAEAFMLMWYSCEHCSHRERIWNSRDGVTPFTTACPNCGKYMVHADWNLDVYASDHELDNKQRFWRDGTPDEAEAYMRRRITQMRELYPCSPIEEAELIQDARLGKLGEFRPGWPFLDIVT